ncbi:protein-glutamate O-methyltransferase CheR [Myxococcota bacterium]|nr:protein-glutamate O-methyltransferase CheR [Myxococcota bacterium]
MTEDEIMDVEVQLFLDGLFAVWGYDFRGYARAALGRRIAQWLSSTPWTTLSEAQAHVLRERRVFDDLLGRLTVNVTQMFRDPPFFRAIREHVVPHLDTWPFVKIWLAGCASGEEAYSLAIVLHEEGLRGRFHLYATDINREALARAEDGLLSLAEMQQHTDAYLRAGGRGTFSRYYCATRDGVRLCPELRDGISFASHNLAQDASFGAMNMIFCRNVLIYFQNELRETVLGLFDDSLVAGGFLCLGTKESLERHGGAERYEVVDRATRIYRKRYV